MNIVIIGMSGAGKTTVGKKLASRLNYKFFDTDELIVSYMNKSIDEIFRDYGEDKFRKIEEKIIKAISKEENAVISTGGGAILSKRNVDSLKKTGRFFYLKASINTLIRNLRTSKINRPLLENGMDLDKNLKIIYSKRKYLYDNYSDVTILVDDKSIDNIVNDIVRINKNVES